MPTQRLKFKRLPQGQRRVEWRYRHGDVSATVAAGGVGKSALKIAEALAMASARDLLAVGGIKSPLRVWYWNLEDPSDELTRRIQATAMRYGLDQTDIEDRLFVDTGREQELLIAESTRRGRDPAPTRARCRLRKAPSGSRTCDSTTARPAASLTTSPFRLRRAKRSGWSGAPAPASRRWSICSCAFTTSRAGAS